MSQFGVNIESFKVSIISICRRPHKQNLNNKHQFVDIITNRLVTVKFLLDSMSQC